MLKVECKAGGMYTAVELEGPAYWDLRWKKRILYSEVEQREESTGQQGQGLWRGKGWSGQEQDAWIVCSTDDFNNQTQLGKLLEYLIHRCM